MKETSVYKQIAESIRQQAIDGKFKPGDRLPSVRQMALQWGCTLGTVQKAYQELSRQGLIDSRPGRGTRITKNIPPRINTPIRKANLVHRAENFLLEVLTTGYTQIEIEQAFRLAMDRWRTLQQTPISIPENIIRFTGSHDIAIDWIAANFSELASDYSLDISFTGSIGGLIALSEGKTDIAGCHLWDEENDDYNSSFVRHFLPGSRIALITMAYRRLGLITLPDNPLQVFELNDLVKPGVKFVNRQSGSGTRIWLDANLKKDKISSQAINNYENAVATHTELAQSIAEGKANVGIGLETVALAYGLNFKFLTKERYDIIAKPETLEKAPIANLPDWLKRNKTRYAIAGLGGYETENSGKIIWVD